MNIEDDVSALLRARNPFLWVITREEQRAELTLATAAAKARYVPHFWDAVKGPQELNGAQTPGLQGLNNVDEMLNRIEQRSINASPNRDVWILRDLDAWLDGMGGAVTRRFLRNLSRSLPGTQNAQAIIVITTNPKVPEDLAGHATVIEWPLPSRSEIATVLTAAISALPDGIRDQAAQNGTFEAAVDAAVGLTAEEAASCYAKSLVLTKKIDPALIAGEKKRVITRERVLEWYDPIPGGLSAVGGLENLKYWLNSRASAYSPAARKYGLPAPKGLLLVGVPGCGKSLTAKAISTAWQCPLLRLDMGALQSKFVGESQANLRRAFRVIETLGRCVVWIDEIEKALAGATQGAADGGVSADALGTLLSWMQEHKSEAFIIATSNDVSALPPELLRKGRFDEIFFVDLPSQEEREAILSATLKQYPAESVGQVYVQRVAAACQDFTGSEIAAIVPEGMFDAFRENERALCTGDLLAAAKNVVPLAETSKEKITKLREWAKTRARNASKQEQQAPATSGRRVEVE